MILVFFVMLFRTRETCQFGNYNNVDCLFLLSMPFLILENKNHTFNKQFFYKNKKKIK